MQKEVMMEIMKYEVSKIQTFISKSKDKKIKEKEKEIKELGDEIKNLEKKQTVLFVGQMSQGF